MALTNPNYILDTTFSGKDISAGASVYQYTATANIRVIFYIWATVAGSGDYVVWLKHQWLGVGTAHEVGPRTTITPTGTDLFAVTLEYDLKNTDVVDVMIDGLAGDTDVSGGIRIVASNPSIFDNSADNVIVGTNNDKLNYALSAAGIDSIHDEIVEGTLTERQLLRILLAALAGKSDGGGSPSINFRDLADSKNRISATVDASGNRTAITLDGS